MIERQLTLAEVARHPRPGMAAPRRAGFTPDGLRVVYLFSQAGTLTQDLWTYDIAAATRRQVTGTMGRVTAEAARSLDEDLRRERSRTRESGVTNYHAAREGADGPPILLVPLDGRVYLARGEEPPIELAGAEGAVDPHLSPDGSRVAFVREGDLFVVPADGSAPPRRLTHGAGDGVTNGLAEYIAQEEMGRQDGYWWSPDSQQIAFVHADSSHIPQYPIVHQGAEIQTVEWHRYPFAGARNAAVRLGVVAVAEDAAEAAWMDLGPDDECYLARVAWRPDGTLTTQIQSRDQRSLRLVTFDVATGAATVLIEERGDPWLNLNDDARFLKSGELIWSSEKSGFRHLYLHDREGREIRALTGGPWMVTGGLAVDEERRLVYFQGTRDGVLQRHLYVASLDSGPPRRLTREDGWHETVVSPGYRHFVDTWSDLGHAPRVTLRDLADSAERAVLFEDPGTTPAALGLCVPELTTIRGRDGTELQAAIYASEATRAEGQPRPLVVSVYGGPHAQTVTDSWSLTVDLRAQYLAQQGFVVLKVDNRGSANRGLAFESAIAGNLGHVELDDQLDGVRALAARPYIDGERVGIYGWSYGGYMACRALFGAPEVFKAGVAGAPVTFWEGYDTHYTERYLGQPATNDEGYLASSLLPQAGALRGGLLLVHGLADENVHARHTMRLLAALTAAAKPYELVLFPDERHMPRRPADLEYLERRLVEFLQRHLL